MRDSFFSAKTFICIMYGMLPGFSSNFKSKIYLYYKHVTSVDFLDQNFSPCNLFPDARYWPCWVSSGQ